MDRFPPSGCRPQKLLRVEGVWQTSMWPVLAVTDVGKAYVKPLGGADSGPHSLACEWIGTRLAEWLGLPVLDHAIIDLTSSDAQQIRDLLGGRAEAGPAFATKAIEATPWGGSPEEIEKVSNLEAVSGMVVFDTWTLNWDRCPPIGDARKSNYDNVLLASHGANGVPGRLVAIDHGECFAVAQELTQRLATVDRVHDERIFGLFPGFKPLVRLESVLLFVKRMAQVERKMISDWVASIPNQWQVTDNAKRALVELVCNRSVFLADRLVDTLRGALGRLF